MPKSRMKIAALSFVICYMMFGTPTGANIIDNIIMRNWKDKETKQDDPFFNPFGLTFPLFGSADDPMTSFLKSEEGKEMRTKREARKAKLPKPWFSISEFLTLPEMSRKTKAEGRKLEGGSVGGNTAETAVPNDKITQTGDLAQTKSPSMVEEGKVGQAHGANELALPPENIHLRDEDDGMLKNQLEFDLRLPENHTSNRVKTQSKFSFPKGLSDILIIFQKVGPKPKTHQLMAPDVVDHECDEFCHNGICEMRGPWNRGSVFEHEITKNTEEKPGPTASEIPHHKKTQFLGQYERICIFAIPIALGIGTLLFIFELRRIIKKMKKQSVLSTFEHQEC